MKTKAHFLMSDVYDYLMENDQSIGTNFIDEFPATWVDDEKGIIYLAKNEGISLFKIRMEMTA
jgi:hypothetical protein